MPRLRSNINVGIYLFPDNQDQGSLETLCLKALKHNKLKSKLDCIGEYFRCIRRFESKMTENNISKSKFRVFMATPDPDNYVKKYY